MPADFNKVITTEAYATLLETTITGLFKDMVKGLDPALALGTLNTPTNALRWNSANGYDEKYNGTTWVQKASVYNITISGSAAKWTTGRTIQLTGDVTGTSASFDGSGNLSFAVALATVTAAKGGTGQTSYAVGDMLYASGASALSKLADVATGSVLLSGGVGVAPSYGKVGLTTHISGTLGIANGGTNATTAAAARTNLGLAIGTDVMGMGGGAFTGAVSATNLSGTNTGDEPDASLTVAGIIRRATTSEVQAGTDPLPAVTPATLAACTATTTRLGVVKTATDAQAKGFDASVATALTPNNLYWMRFETGEYAFAAGTVLSFSHGMGSVPLASIEAVFRCKITEGNYAVGDEIIYSSHYASGAAWTVWQNATQIGIAFLTAVKACNKTTGVGFDLTAANWKVSLRTSLN